MKKAILYLLFLMPMISCSDDDSSAKPQEVPLISKLTLETANAPTQIFYFTYDAKNRIEKIVTDGGSTRRYAYNNENYLKSITYNDDPQVVFYYNQQNIITAYDFGNSGVESPVTYHAAQNSYSMPPNSYTLNAQDDVSVADSNKINFTEKNGVFANVNGKNLHLMNYFAGVLPFISSKMAVENVVDQSNNIIYKMETQYNESGFPVKIEIKGFFGFDDMTVNLEY